MIIIRYLSKNIFITLSAVSLILLLIMISSRGIKYLSQAAEGLIDSSYILLIIMFRIPSFLQLIIPLGLLMSILLVYGKLYLESEMIVLTAAGLSKTYLLVYTLIPVVVVFLIVSYLSFFLSPYCMGKFIQVYSKQYNSFDKIVKGRFNSLKNTNLVVNIEGVSQKTGQFINIFISKSSKLEEQKKTFIFAQNGSTLSDGINMYLILKNGYIYDWNQVQSTYKVIHYDKYAILLNHNNELSKYHNKYDDIPTMYLIKNIKNVKCNIELQWRMSISFLVFIITLFAIPLSKVNPKKGSFFKIFPAIIFYISYLFLLIIIRSKMDLGNIPISFGLLSINLILLFFGLLYYIFIYSM